MSDLGNKEIMANNIKHYMEINNITRTELCKALNIKYSTMSEWINGKAYPRIDKIELMANYFGITKADLVEEKKPTLDEQLEGIEFALWGEVKELTDDEKQDILNFVRFVKEQKKKKDK